MRIDPEATLTPPRVAAAEARCDSGSPPMVAGVAREHGGGMNDTSQTTEPPPVDPSNPGSSADPINPGDPADSGPRVSGEQMRDVNRLRRPAQRTIAGVAAGLARHFDIDPLIVRVAFVVLAFFGGSGLLLYGALWLLMPEDGEEQAAVNLDPRSRQVAIVGVGIAAALLLLGDSWGLYWFPWPLALIALAVWFFGFRDRTPRQVAPGVPGAPGQPAPTPYAAPPTPYAAGPTTYAAAPTTYSGPATYAAGPTTYAAAPTAYAAAPPTYAAPRPPVTRPRDPRRRGPILFWFTLALIALGMGTLGLVAVGMGVDVPVSAYPALAMTITAVMLLVGAWYGRAGGLIMLGLLAGAATLGATAVEQHEREVRIVTPATASAVQDRYWMPAGELVLDLREVSDPENLDNRTIVLEGGIGRLRVIVPEEFDGRARAAVNGPGSIVLFDRASDGVDISAATTFGPGEGDPWILIEAELGVGEIAVTDDPSEETLR